MASDRAEQQTHAPGQGGDNLHGANLIEQLRHGWSPLPTRTVFSLVMAGLRVRLTRSLVTMLAVILAIAFLTYTGLSNKLSYNLAVLTTELADSPGVPAAEVERAVDALAALDPARGDLPEPPAWLGLWLDDSPETLRDQIEIAAAPPVDHPELERLQRRLDLLLWLRSEAPETDPAVLEEQAHTFLRERATRFIPNLRNPAAWDTVARARADFLLEAYRTQEEGAEPVEVIDRFIAVEERRETAADLARMLRRSGVNIEATLRGSFADTWIIVMALLLCTVGIANAMLMSVTERFREIGTMKCLGAQDGLVVKLFLLESAFLGVTGAVLGAVLGVAVALGAGLLQFGGFTMLGFPVFDSIPVLGGALLAGILLAVVGTLYPAVLAARMNPVDALRIDE